MRTVVNISLPQQMYAAVEEVVATGHYASKSEFFRDLLRLWMERKLTREISRSEDEFRAGKGKKLRSLKDLP